MTITDLVLILIIAGFAFTGFWFGFIHMLGSAVSIVAAAIFAGKYFEPLAQKLTFLFAGNQALARVVIFILLFLLVTRLVGFVFWIINKIFHIIAILPFLKTFNRLGGAILGLFEGLVLTSTALFIIVRYPLGETLTAALEGSQVVGYLLTFAQKLAPLLPQALTALKSLLNI